MHFLALAMRTAVLGLVIPSVMSSVLLAQKSARDLKIEVRDKAGLPLAGVIVDFYLTRDSARTDSTGNARVTVQADSIIDIGVRKLGYEPRQARFRVGNALGFTIRVNLGEVGTQLAEVEVRENYAEPWRNGWELRKRRGGGQFRDMSAFASRMPNTIDDWFGGLPGVRTGGGAGNEINVPRCRRLGLWIDGQHATTPDVDYRFALSTIPAQDIAAIELYTSNTPAQYTGYAEDCSLLVWTRFR